MTADSDAQRPVWLCGSCQMEDLACMNRLVMDRVRCCQRCNGHGIPLTDTGRQFLVDAGVADGDGITLLMLVVADARARRGG